MSETIPEKQSKWTKTSILLACAVGGFICSLPALLFLPFGIPGNCESNPGYCALWKTMATMVAFPFYGFLIGLVFVFTQKLQIVVKLMSVALIVVPLGASLLFLYTIF